MARKQNSRENRNGTVRDVLAEDEILTAEEAAKLLKVSCGWLYKNIDRLPYAVKLGENVIRFSRNGIRKHLFRDNGASEALEVQRTSAPESDEDFLRCIYDKLSDADGAESLHRTTEVVLAGLRKESNHPLVAELISTDKAILHLTALLMKTVRGKARGLLLELEDAIVDHGVATQDVCCAIGLMEGHRTVSHRIAEASEQLNDELNDDSCFTNYTLRQERHKPAA